MMDGTTFSPVAIFTIIEKGDEWMIEYTNVRLLRTYAFLPHILFHEQAFKLFARMCSLNASMCCPQ